MIILMLTWATQPAKSVTRFFQASKDSHVTCQSTEAVSSVKSAGTNFHPNKHSSITSRRPNYGKDAKEK
jgi:hypothetical protein